MSGWVIAAICAGLAFALLTGMWLGAVLFLNWLARLSKKGSSSNG